MRMMRTIPEAYAYLLKEDPETAITKTALRRMVVSGAIPSLKVGRKYLVPLEAIDAYLSGEEREAPSLAARGIIRPVEVRR